MSRETWSSGTEWGRPSFNNGHSTPETEISILCLCLGTCFSRRISCFIVRENKKFNSPSPAKPLMTNSVPLEYSRGEYLGLSYYAIPFFFFVYRRMRFLIMGRSVGLKKENLKKKKSQEVSEGIPGRR